MFETPAEQDAATGLPIGPLVDTAPASIPPRVTLAGRYCTLEPLDPQRHGDALFTASTPDDAAARFLYLPVDAPANRAEFDAWIVARSASTDPMYWAVIDNASGLTVGRQSYLRIDPTNRSIEIGDIYWGPGMARTRLSTEASYLFMRYAFESLTYRRYEWKCNALNAPSRRSALRFGFTFEGEFRRAMIVKGRNRDTAWYSIIDEEWPALNVAYNEWLDPANFDAAGGQRRPLAECIADRRAAQ